MFVNRWGRCAILYPFVETSNLALPLPHQLFPAFCLSSSVQMASVPTKLLIKQFLEREYKSCVKFCCLLFLCFVAQWSGRISRTAISCLQTPKPEITLCTTRFNIKKFYVLPTQCIFVMCMDLRTNSDYFPIQHWLTSLYSWNGVCLLRGTDWIFIYNSTFYPHRVFMCFVWISEQTAIISPYSINWLVCIAETECVYCAVRTGSLYTTLCSTHTVYLCVLCGSQKKQPLFPYTALTDLFL